MPMHVDDAFDRLLAYLSPIRRHLPGTIVITNVLPLNWMFLRLFFRLFSEAKAIHVRRQEQVFIACSALEESLQPYLRPKIFSMELFWISNAATAPQFADWFLAPAAHERFVRVIQGLPAVVEVIRVLYERVLLHDHPVFNRCVLIVHLEPINWHGITEDQLDFMNNVAQSSFPKPNPRTGAQFLCAYKGTYVAVVICSEIEAGR